MKSRQNLVALSICSTLFLLAFPATARSDAAHPEHQESSSDPPSQPAMNHSMPGMDHPMTGGHSMPNMPEMSHGSAHQMSLGPDDENFDLRFLDAMILHHQGALAMAEEAVEKSDRVSISRMSRQIVLDQRREIRRMQDWRRNWYPNASAQPVMYGGEMGSTIPMSAQMQAAMRMDADMGAADDEFDLRFINAMIEHHEGAIDMAGEALARSDRPDIRRLARSILQFQQREIAQMRAWRSQWYGG